ncbi:hypothetical protein [Actinomycetospora soli]|uniref:hypothetical protein n=1 Tax=Actinomycetospora soli TaxID=2893887 RepID=UPI001E5E2335|nr:hypothetical protein [Actinomycetospora soli]MCD2190973.1 hypothetical protein [Actinomycetospora soli]
MSYLGMDVNRQSGLSERARDALTRELFARWEAAEPGRHHCFIGSDAEMVAAVERLRHQDRHDLDSEQHRDNQDRERG